MFELDVNKHILPLVVGIVLVFVGLTAANIAGGIGQYTIQTLNQSVSGAIKINLLSSDTVKILSTVAMFAGITLLVFAVAEIIWALLQSTRSSLTVAGA